MHKIDSIRNLKTSVVWRTEKLCAESSNTRYYQHKQQKINYANASLSLQLTSRTMTEYQFDQSLIRIDAHYQEHSLSFTQDNLCGLYRAS